MSFHTNLHFSKDDVNGGQKKNEEKSCVVMRESVAEDPNSKERLVVEFILIAARARPDATCNSRR